MKKIPNRVYLTEDELPKQYYNIAADMPNKPQPYLNPMTKQPVAPADLEPLFARVEAYAPLYRKREAA